VYSRLIGETFKGGDVAAPVEAQRSNRQGQMQKAISGDSMTACEIQRS